MKLKMLNIFDTYFTLLKQVNCSLKINIGGATSAIYKFLNYCLATLLNITIIIIILIAIIM